MATVELTDADHEKILSLRVGDVLSVNLSENPTTGYRWFLDQPLPQFLTPKSDEFLAPQLSAAGAGGTRNLRFLLGAKGRGDLSTKLYREWEGPQSSIREFRIQIEAID